MCDNLHHVSSTQHWKQAILRFLVPALLFFRTATRIAENLLRRIPVAQADPDSGAQIQR